MVDLLLSQNVSNDHWKAARDISDKLFQAIYRHTLSSKALYLDLPAPNIRGLPNRLDNINLWIAAAAGIMTLREHDPETANHALCCAELLAYTFANNHVNPRTRALHYIAAMLHDIGKLAIRPELLNKKEQLSEDEWGQLRGHPEIGAAALCLLKKHFVGNERLRTQRDIDDFNTVIRVALCHHIRLDKSGYPEWAIRADIPEIVMQVAICDGAHAMSGRWAHRHPKTLLETVLELQNEAASGKLPDREIRVIVRSLREGLGHGICAFAEVTRLLRQNRTFAPALS